MRAMRRIGGRWRRRNRLSNSRGASPRCSNRHLGGQRNIGPGNWENVQSRFCTSNFGEFGFFGYKFGMTNCDVLQQFAFAPLKKFTESFVEPLSHRSALGKNLACQRGVFLGRISGQGKSTYAIPGSNFASLTMP